MTWFLLDISFYGNGLFSSVIVKGFGLVDTSSVRSEVLGTAKLNVYLTLMAVPGYFAAIYLIDRLGRRKLQLYGFLALAGAYFLIAILSDAVQTHLVVFFILYGITFFLSNAGPNTTTFIVPAEAFPIQIRATCHGISAAAGKVGAVVGASSLLGVKASGGVGAVMVVCGVTALLGALVTYFFTAETRDSELNNQTTLTSPDGVPQAGPDASGDGALALSTDGTLLGTATAQEIDVRTLVPLQHA